MVKKLWQYVIKQFSSNTGTSGTDRQRDGGTDLPYQYCAQRDGIKNRAAAKTA